jgi:hypothetical protein
LVIGICDVGWGGESVGNTPWGGCNLTQILIFKTCYESLL